MKFTKQHHAICFEMKAMLAEYIKFNINQCASAGTDKCKRKRNFFKIMNNAPYEQTIENG